MPSGSSRRDPPSAREGNSKQGESCRQPCRPLSIQRHDLWKAFNKGFAQAVLIRAAKASHAQDQLNLRVHSSADPGDAADSNYELALKADDSLGICLSPSKKPPRLSMRLRWKSRPGWQCLGGK